MQSVECVAVCSVCCIVLQCVQYAAVCCSVLQCVAVCCSVLSVLQCVAVDNIVTRRWRGRSRGFVSLFMVPSAMISEVRMMPPLSFLPPNPAIMCVCE